MTVGSLHVITDCTVQQRFTPARLAEMAIAGGADVIQYRDKTADVGRMIDQAGEVRSICVSVGVPLIIDDRVDVALAVDAQGVHLGENDMPIAIARRLLGPDAIIGGTIRSAAELRAAMAHGADYVGLGPLYSTATKSVQHAVLTAQTVREVCAAARVPVIGIAGITERTASEAMALGLDGVAVVAAVCASDDPEAATRALRRVVDEALRLRTSA